MIFVQLENGMRFEVSERNPKTFGYKGIVYNLFGIKFHFKPLDKYWHQ